jgi:beta-mannosidase
VRIKFKGHEEGPMRKLVIVILVGLAAAVLGCGLITPRALRKGWQWDGVPRVMPNSFFAPVAAAREVTAQPAPGGAMPAGTDREELSLDGTWRYQPDAQEQGESAGWAGPGLDDSGWKTMPVPSNFVLEDHALANFYGPVWFRTSFTPPATFTGKRTRLIFSGVDYFAKVWLNGELLGEHEGYFNPFMFDLSAKLRPGVNVLAVKVTNPYDDSMRQAQRLWVHMAEKIWVKGVLNYHDSRMGGVANSAYAAQSWGSGGIYQPVKIVATGEAALDWVLISPRLSDNYTAAAIDVEVFATNFTDAPQPAQVILRARGENFAGTDQVMTVSATLPPGPSKLRVNVPIDNPHLWWPRSHPELGVPNLYRLDAALTLAGRATDSASHLFGLREVRLTETGPEAYFWYVNGKRLSFRGTNGIPTQYYSRLTPEYLDEYFQKLRDNNMDILIVHDHQAPPMVYDQADREGMVVLQNFTLIWGISPCDFIRPNGDPNLTNNEQVIGRMAAEAMWYLYNHPSIFWWSMHDESNLIAFGEKGLLPGNFCKKKPYRAGDFMPVFMDLTLNENLDNQLLAIARKINPTIPIHRTGGKNPDSTTYYGWYKTRYWELIKEPQPFPLEFGTEAVPYSMAAVMRYQPDLWPVRDKQAIAEWEYHSMEFPEHETYMGRTIAYDNFNDWAFASQLYQAVVNKYHIEINRENKYHPTGSVLSWMYNEWWPSVNFGIVDWNLEDKIAVDWIKTSFSQALVATRVGKNIYSSGEAVKIPVHAMNDSYLDYRGAKVVWRLVEETDSFFICGHGQPTIENRRSPRHFVTATIGHRQPVAEVAHGELAIDLGPDTSLVAGEVSFSAPRTKEPRHYTLYLALVGADGKIVSANWDHFVVVQNARTFRPPEGISPAPRFRLELALRKSGTPILGTVTVVDKYDDANKYSAALDSAGRAVLDNLRPGAYRLAAGSETYELLLNRDEKLEVDFQPGLKTTLGTAPIIDWPQAMPEPTEP